ncbi:phosphoglycerate mutase [Mucidula mucida]|nr:phosphoglycerate mutase [Mucidula mucida]
MLTVTFIRHGESEDNPKGIWAGWKDAPLSELGRRQAQSLGENLATTKLDVIYASPLLRAHATGVAVQQRQPHNPPLIVNPNLREQHFGIAEGHEWVPGLPRGMSEEDAYKQGLFASTVEKFPEGESMDDLLDRARIAIQEVVFPHLVEAAKGDVHIAVASHGHCIAMLMEALLSTDTTFQHDVEYFGLANTAWTRAIVDVDPSYTATDSPQLSVKVTLLNQHEHLKNVKRSTTAPIEDSTRKEAMAFFGGGSAAVEE